MAEGGAAASDAAQAFLSGLHTDWDARAAGLKSVSTSIRVALVGPDGGSRNLLVVVKYRAPADLRLVLLADMFTLADALVTGRELSVFIPIAQRNYRGAMPGTVSGTAVLPEMAGLGWLQSAGALRETLSGAAPLPSEPGRMAATPANRSDADWIVTVQSAAGSTERRYFVRSSDRAIARAEFFDGGKLTLAVEGRDFRNDGGGVRPYRLTLTPADEKGRAVLQFQEIKRNAYQDPKTYVHAFSSEVSVAPLEQILADRKEWEAMAGGVGK